MIFGIVGLIVVFCVEKLECSGLCFDYGLVLVIGVSGGVGSIVVELLVKFGYIVVVVIGKLEQVEFFNCLGVKQIFDCVIVVDGVDKLLFKEQWVGVVDIVGGDIFFNVVKLLQYGGSVVCCGLIVGVGFKVLVLLFILCGVNLFGVDLVELLLVVKVFMWDKLLL